MILKKRFSYDFSCQLSYALIYLPSQLCWVMKDGRYRKLQRLVSEKTIHCKKF